MPSALNIVQQFFPNVASVSDAKEDLHVEVTKRDTKSATVRNHKACAMAVACKRTLEADGIIMSVSTAYIIIGNQAVRYKVPETVSREIISFDRNGTFETGEYPLKAPSAARKLGMGYGSITNRSTNNEDTRGNLAKRFVHQTAKIRARLGSKHAV